MFSSLYMRIGIAFVGLAIIGGAFVATYREGYRAGENGQIARNNEQMAEQLETVRSELRTTFDHLTAVMEAEESAGKISQERQEGVKDARKFAVINLGNAGCLLSDHDRGVLVEQVRRTNAAVGITSATDTQPTGQGAGAGEPNP